MTKEQEPCDDYISRKEVLNIDFKKIMLTMANPTEMIEQKVKALSSVTPQTKTGYWIRTEERWDIAECSECHRGNSFNTNYCPNCGAKMKCGGEW